MSRILLARHGETAWNACGKLQGRTDIPLNEAGRAQAHELAARLQREPIASVTTSDLSRAAETGDIIARALGLPAPRIDPELRERSFGPFEGLTSDECAARYPGAWRSWVDHTSPVEGAEPCEDAVARLSRAIARIALRAQSRTALVVSHGGVLRLWLSSVLGEKVPAVGNGAVYVVVHDAGKCHVSSWDG